MHETFFLKHPFFYENTTSLFSPRIAAGQLGDLICIAGDLGYAHLGLIACEKSLNGFDLYKEAFLRPTARVKEGMWLGQQSSVHAMMDISDGLLIDLKRLCQLSNMRGNIELDNLSANESFASYSLAAGLDPKETMLIGGEDYSLLFTVGAQEYDDLAAEFKQKFSYEVKPIGQITSGKGVTFTEHGKSKRVKLKPFSHFEESL